MSHLVIGYYLPLLRTHDAVFLFLAYKHLLNGIEEVLLADILPAFLDRIDGRLVDHVGEVGTDGTAGCKSYGIKVNALIHLDILGMNLEYLHTALKIRLVNDYASVESSGSEKCLIKYLGAVGRSEYKYTL